MPFGFTSSQQDLRGSAFRVQLAAVETHWE
jgi:hypothetical protein